MQSLRRIFNEKWAVGLVVALGACGPAKNEGTDGSTGSTGSSTSLTGSTTDVEPTTTATPTSSSETGSSSGSEGTTGMNGFCPDETPPGTAEQCAMETDELGCISWELGGSGHCVWIPYFPVRLMDGVCSFGDPRGQCAFVPCSEEGCATLSPCGPEGFGGAFIIGEDDVVSVGFANWCLNPPGPGQACIFDFEGELLEGPPECACLCDPGFPDAG